MNREDYMAKLRCFAVNCFEPPEDEKKWGKHHTLGVVCRSVVEAVEHVRATQPTYRIEAVNERCIVHYVLDMPGMRSCP